MVPIIKTASSLEGDVLWVFGLLIVNVIFGLFELAANFMHREDALGKQGQDRVVWVRRAVSILLLLIVFFCYKAIYSWDGHLAVAAISENSCTNDIVLGETFKEMRAYLDDVRSGWFKWFMMIVMIAVLLLSVGGALFKMSAEKKYFKDSSNVNASEKSNEGKQQ